MLADGAETPAEVHKSVAEDILREVVLLELRG
jgi:hypothetical protein